MILHQAAKQDVSAWIEGTVKRTSDVDVDEVNRRFGWLRGSRQWLKEKKGLLRGAVELVTQISRLRSGSD
jgi:hypothetical protein